MKKAESEDEGMTRDEAREFLINISYSLGNMSVEYLSEKDGKKMREAIEALEQEPCEDCISRAQAQTELEMNACRYTLAKERGGIGNIEWGNRLIDVVDAVNVIRNLPPVTVLPTQKWIPISKKPPEESGKYLATFGGMHLIGIDFYRTEEDARRDFEEPEEYTGWRSGNVIAWMPLPEPYKENNYES